MTAPEATTPRVAIIGAGVAGAAAASVLRDAGIDAVVFEKSRGPGGRSARRREGRLSFDHGAQYFTARDERFRRVVEDALAAGDVAPWSPRLVSIGRSGVTPVESDTPRFVGAPGMNALTRRLLAHTPIRLSARVTGVAGSGAARVFLTFEERRIVGPFGWVLLTLPAPQVAPLLPEGSPLRESIASVKMIPTWAAMLAFDHPLALPFDGARVDHPTIAWIARNNSKPGRAPSPETWIIHASHEWSAAHLDDSPEAALDALLGSFRDVVGRPARPIFARVHRWRYAAPARPLGVPCVTDPDAPITLAGDWCLDARVEGAFLSGSAAGRQIAAALARAAPGPAPPHPPTS